MSHSHVSSASLDPIARANLARRERNSFALIYYRKKAKADTELYVAIYEDLLTQAFAKFGCLEDFWLKMSVEVDGGARKYHEATVDKILETKESRKEFWNLVSPTQTPEDIDRQIDYAIECVELSADQAYEAWKCTHDDICDRDSLDFEARFCDIFERREFLRGDMLKRHYRYCYHLAEVTRGLLSTVSLLCAEDEKMLTREMLQSVREKIHAKPL